MAVANNQLTKEVVVEQQKLFSETLRELGFSPADEMSLRITWLPDKGDHGKFCRTELIGKKSTVAVDETGRMWIADEHVDLVLYGFEIISTDTGICNSESKKKDTSYFNDEGLF